MHASASTRRAHKDTLPLSRRKKSHVLGKRRVLSHAATHDEQVLIIAIIIIIMAEFALGKLPTTRIRAMCTSAWQQDFMRSVYCATSVSYYYHIKLYPYRIVLHIRTRWK